MFLSITVVRFTTPQRNCSTTSCDAAAQQAKTPTDGKDCSDTGKGPTDVKLGKRAGAGGADSSTISVAALQAQLDAVRSEIQSLSGKSEEPQAAAQLAALSAQEATISAEITQLEMSKLTSGKKP